MINGGKIIARSAGTKVPSGPYGIGARHNVKTRLRTISLERRERRRLTGHKPTARAITSPMENGTHDWYSMRLRTILSRCKYRNAAAIAVTLSPIGTTMAGFKRILSPNEDGQRRGTTDVRSANWSANPASAAPNCWIPQDSYNLPVPVAKKPKRSRDSNQ